MSSYESYYEAAAAGAVIISVNRRLARTLHAGYADWQLRNGLLVWEQPQILTLDSWLRSCVVATGAGGLLLNSAQADCLWQQIVRNDLHKNGISLLQVQATARLVAQAHRLLLDAGVDICGGLDGATNHDNYYRTAEYRAFLRWQADFIDRCQRENWIDPSSLTQYTADLFASGKLSPPPQLIVVGFDTVTAAQSLLLRRLRQLGCNVEVVTAASEPEHTPECIACTDEDSEIAAAARWARQRLEQRDGRVAVVVPELERLATRVERIFSAELGNSEYPELVPVDTFNLSLGKPLARQGLIATALATLEVILEVDDEIEFERISYLLRSPWLAGGVSAAAERANFESYLRRRNIHTISLVSLLKLAGNGAVRCASFVPVLEKLCAARADKGEKTLVQWADNFIALLNQVGWPGQRSLGSADYQVLGAWSDKVMPAFAALAVVHPPTSRGSALALLRKLANEQLFQPQAQGSRLQILGMLESAGLHFDALWVTGLSDQVLPGRVQFNPFLPVALQRQYNMPHSSIEHESSFARLTMQRLLGAAGQVVLSYPCTRDGSVLLPSPFLQPYLSHDGAQQQILSADNSLLPTSGALQGSALEYIVDDTGAALGVTAESDSGDNVIDIRGGTAVLREQALCPFRAYIHHRLQGRALESIHAGLDGRLRGQLIHKVLERFWQRVGSHQQLCLMQAQQLRDMVEADVTSVLSHCLKGTDFELVPLEKERLTALVVNWLTEYEKPRAPFRVLELEQVHPVRIRSLRFSAVPDRVDCLEDGSHIVIDYKSAKMSNSGLVGEKLLEPQLPIYALHSLQGDGVMTGHDTVADGVVFAQIRAGECGFKGVAAHDGLVPGVKSVDSSGAAKRGINDWETLLADWQCQLNGLADDFVMARAQVKPAAKQACQFCDLHGLCRIAAQQEIAGGTDADS